jgi:hypothetical protein
LSKLFADGGYQGPQFCKAQKKALPHLDASKNSPIWFVSDSIGVGESEMIPCEVSQDFSMSMIA